VTDRVDLDDLERLEQAATPGPWRVNVHASGTTNVVMRTGDCWNEHGPGMLYATILLYNQGAYSYGATDDGVQVERQTCARLIAAARNALPGMIRELRAARELLERVLQLHDSTRGEYFMPDPWVREIRANLDKRRLKESP
jgi:hypothetical protein